MSYFFVLAITNSK